MPHRETFVLRLVWLDSRETDKLVISLRSTASEREEVFHSVTELDAFLSAWQAAQETGRTGQSARSGDG